MSDGCSAHEAGVAFERLGLAAAMTPPICLPLGPLDRYVLVPAAKAIIWMIDLVLWCMGHTKES